MTAVVEPGVFAPGVAHQVAAMLTVFAVEGHAPALRTLAVRFLTGDPVTQGLGWCSWVLLDDGPPCWCVTTTTPPGPDAEQAARAFARQETP